MKLYFVVSLLWIKFSTFTFRLSKNVKHFSIGKVRKNMNVTQIVRINKKLSSLTKELFSHLNMMKLSIHIGYEMFFLFMKIFHIEFFSRICVSICFSLDFKNIETHTSEVDMKIHINLSLLFYIYPYQVTLCMQRLDIYHSSKNLKLHDENVKWDEAFFIWKHSFCSLSLLLDIIFI